MREESVKDYGLPNLIQSSRYYASMQVGSYYD